ncbi:alkaline phosphatase family protein [Segetibacter aerophilus]|uniref:Alkaline phosphatase family protein n=1 Tax=Segetibacter aerophilus TaxID=670293 RepID=A0A512B780_9BACT|nr:ectonucleotide pyrophosphatase/phosphodiesterase [Segetibacter aerophilus]GEO07823.1 alkaline phosphatase family protein [Segetibacter aerophilus]
MKKASLLFLVSFLVLQLRSQQVKHVILITIDGFRPDFYLDEKWDAPNIRGLMKDGAHTKGMNSVFPSMTYPSHTTIVTGVQPVKHSIYYNNMFEPTGSTGKIYWNTSQIKTPTLWGAAQAKGLKATALFWPVSADAPVSYNIPDIGSMGEGVREQYSKPEGFVNTIKKEVFNGAEKVEWGKDENVAKIAAYVIKKDKPNLMTIHFFWVDHIEHQEGREGDVLKAAVKDADQAVGIVINALKEEGIWNNTVLIVTGDHGFVDVKTNVSPNVWLAKAGLLTDIKKDDWKAQFYTVGGSAYLYLKDKNDSKTLDQVKEMLSKLPEEEKKLFKIIDRRQLDAAGANPEVALALTGENGASFGNAATGDATKRGKGGAHGYFPDFHEIQTGFVAFGPGIKKGGVIPVMNVRDIAPAVSKLLGFSFPSAESKIPAGLLIRD